MSSQMASDAAKQRKKDAARDFLKSAVMPLIEDVLVKKFCQTMDVISESSRESGVIMNAADRENLAIGRAINRAAEMLPEGWEIRITIERDAGAVEAVSPDGDVLGIDCGDLFSEQVGSAIVRAAESIGEPSHDNQ